MMTGSGSNCQLRTLSGILAPFSPVRPGETGPVDLPTEHRQLVVQDEYLGILRYCVHLVDAEEREESAQEPVEE